MLKQAQELQKKLEVAQKELEAREVTGESGAGVVQVVMSLKGSVKSIRLDESIIKVEDKEMLEDLILAALNDAKTRADSEYQKGMQEAGVLDMPGTPKLF
jgi:DNA-binding YbaB/EbfC family protein